MNQPKSAYISVLKIPLLFLAFTPLVFYQDALFPYNFPKTVFIRLMVTIFWVGLAVFLAADLYGSRRIHADIRINPFVSAFIRVWKNPLFIAVSAFMFLATLSAVLAVNPYRAFWGNAERGEGLTGLFFFFGFFVASLLIFRERDWKNFFMLTLGAAAVLFAEQVSLLKRGVSLFGAPGVAEIPMHVGGALAGNPNFLAAFYLFSIFAALRVFHYPHDSKPKLFKAFSVVAAALSFTGIFLSGSRGVVVGLAAGALGALVFLASHKDVPMRSRRAALVLLASAVLFAAAFVGTRRAAFWQKFPVLNEIAAFSADDANFRSRLLSYRVSMQAINPAANGVKRLILGWGPEGFSIAHQSYLDPSFLRYEFAWFDRAHNKLLDVLVMQGVAGLLMYLVIWFLVFYSILRKPRTLMNADSNLINADNESNRISVNQRVSNQHESAALLFFGISYFIQNLFAFDVIVTHIPIFAFFAYVVSLRPDSIEWRIWRFIPRYSATGRRIILCSSTVLAAMFFAAVLAVTLVSLRQMVSHIPALRAGRADVLMKNFDRAVKPYTYVQSEIRTSFLSAILKAIVKNENVEPIMPLLQKLIEASAEAANRERTSARQFLVVASGYELTGDLKTAEIYRQKALKLASSRQEIIYSLAVTRARQGETEEAKRLAKELLALDPEGARSKIYYAVIISLADKEKAFGEAMGVALSVFDGPVKFSPTEEELRILRNVFNFYLANAYDRRDAVLFLETLKRAKTFEEIYEANFGLQPSKSVETGKMIEAFRARGWDAFKVQIQR